MERGCRTRAAHSHDGGSRIGAAHSPGCRDILVNEVASLALDPRYPGASHTGGKYHRIEEDHEAHPGNLKGSVSHLHAARLSTVRAGACDRHVARKGECEALGVSALMDAVLC